MQCKRYYVRKERGWSWNIKSYEFLYWEGVRNRQNYPYVIYGRSLKRQSDRSHPDTYPLHLATTANKDDNSICIYTSNPPKYFPPTQVENAPELCPLTPAPRVLHTRYIAPTSCSAQLYKAPC